MLAHIVFIGAVFLVLARTAEVNLNKTTVIGVDDPLLGLEIFRGIPYAEPPIGPLRFQPPLIKTYNTTTLNATEFGPACLQLNTTSSEDCLTINIWRPAGIPATQSSLPVMVFIHGGGFTAGTGSIMDGSLLVAQSVLRGTPVVYASINYRLGPLGFAAGAEAAVHKALNLGLQDQLTALEWVQTYIDAFGGDKNKVLVFGESAGAVSIGTLMLKSSFGNLARAAILESGSGGTTFTFDALRRQNAWNNFAKGAGCTSASLSPDSCLRSVSSESLLKGIDLALKSANEQFPFVPTLDGPGGIMPSLPSEVYKKGTFAKIPFIAGTNLDEVFTPLDIADEKTIFNGIVSNYSASPLDKPVLNLAATNILRLYPNVPALGSPYNTGNETFGLSPQYKRSAAITGDLLFHAPRRLLSEAAARVGVRSYSYLFTDPPPSNGIFPPFFGVSHGLEILYVFGFLPLINATLPSLHLGAQMIDYWISFANSLDPNDSLGNTRALWPQYSLENSRVLQLHAENVSAIADDYRKEQISFLNAVPSLFRH